MIRKRWILAVALLCILCGTVGYVVAQSSPSVPYIMGGPYPGAPSYTMWTESSTFYAKDANGQIDFSSTNCSAVIEDVLDVFARGGYGLSEANRGHLFFQEGNYTGLTGNFTVPDGTLIEGEGIASKLQMGDYDMPLFFLRGYNIQIRNLNLQGTKSAGAKSYAHGIWIYAPASGTTTGYIIENCLIYGFNHTGIYVSGGASSHENIVHIHGNTIYGNGYDGIYLGGTHAESYIDSNSINTNAQSGIHLVGTCEVSIQGNDIYDNGNVGIYAYASWNFAIENNEIIDSGNHGVLVQHASSYNTFAVISNNRIANNDHLGIFSGGIFLENANRSTLEGNVCFNVVTTYQDYGIRETGVSNWNIIVGNICYGTIVGITKVGANTVYEHNINQTG